MTQPTAVQLRELEQKWRDEVAANRSKPFRTATEASAYLQMEQCADQVEQLLAASEPAPEPQGGGELAEQNAQRMDAERYRFLCEHPHWGFIEELCREFVAESPAEFKAGLDAAIAKRWGSDEFMRIGREAAGTKVFAVMHLVAKEHISEPQTQDDFHWVRANYLPAKSISDEVMDLVDRLGSEASDVDPRAWEHLKIYMPALTPKPSTPQECNHEPYLGACVHCGCGFREGRPVFAPASTDAPQAESVPVVGAEVLGYCRPESLASLRTLRSNNGAVGTYIAKVADDDYSVAIYTTPQADGEGEVNLFPEAVPSRYVREYGQDGDMWVRLHVAETALRIAASKAPAEVTDGWAKGVQACIDWVEKRRHDFEMEHGMVDPSTGAMEFRNTAREEYDIELCEIEEGLRTKLALRPTSTTRAGEG